MLNFYTNPRCSKCQVVKRYLKQFVITDYTEIKAEPNTLYPRLENTTTGEVIVGYFKIKRYLENHAETRT